MRRHIRIIYPVKPMSFSEQLEKRAQDVIKKGRNRESRSTSTTVSALEQEIALVLDQIGGVRDLHENVRRSLLCQECYTDTELTWMEARTPRYSPYRFPERFRLQRILFDIEKERRRLALLKDEQNRGLHGRLLELLNRHAVVADTPRGSRDRAVAGIRKAGEII